MQGSRVWERARGRSKVQGSRVGERARGRSKEVQGSRVGVKQE